MANRSLATPDELVFEDADYRLRRWASGLAIGLPILGFGVGSAEWIEPVEALVSIVTTLFGLFFLVALLARQRVSFLTGVGSILVGRRILGVAWRREAIPFSDVKEVWLAWDEKDSGAQSRWQRRLRPVTLTRRQGGPVLVTASRTSAIAQAVASRLADLLRCRVHGSTPEMSAQEAARMAWAPERLRSDVRRAGEELRVTVDPVGTRRRGVLFFLGFMGITVALLFAFVFLSRLLRSDAWDPDPAILAGVVLGGMALGLATFVWLSRHRFGRPPLVVASPRGLVVRRPRWISGPEKIVLNRDQGVVVEVRAGKPGGLCISGGDREVIVGQTLPRGELDWLAAALNQTLASSPRTAREEPSTGAVARAIDVVPTPAQDHENGRMRWTPSNVGFLLFLLGGLATAIVGVFTEWWIFAAVLAMALVILAQKNARLWWLKNQRREQSFTTFATHFATLGASTALLQEIYDFLSDAGDWIKGVPVLPADHLERDYGVRIRDLTQDWVAELARNHGLRNPTRDELKDVTTVEDLVRLLAAER